MDAQLTAQMREDWNRRAVEDAHYYVAFGRRNQNDDEFFAMAWEQVRGLELETRRLLPAARRARRALEIGCGPGRLMRPLSRHFGEIHGVDISDEMVRLAREKLAGIPHAHVHSAPNSNLEAFADSSFDFVYSYAVFQHIPSREVVLNYLREAARVLKPGGVIRCQLNGLPKAGASAGPQAALRSPEMDTWSGVRFDAAEIREFAKSEGLRLLALEGIHTQYMWVTLTKPIHPVVTAASAPLRIRRVTNAHSTEPVTPVTGRFAVLAIWIENFPPSCDLNTLEVLVDGRPGSAYYIGPPEMDGLQQVNVYLPEGLGTGLAPMHLAMGGQALCADSHIRLIQPGPPVPQVVLVGDGVDLLSANRIVTGSVKVRTEEVHHPEQFWAKVGDRDARDIRHFCTDPLVPNHEFDFALPEGVPPGPAWIRMGIGRRELQAVQVEIVSSQ